MKRIVRDQVVYSDFFAIADDKGNKITYRELADKAQVLAAYMEERSIVFVLCDHQMETAEFLYQALYLNRVPLLLAGDLDMELLQRLVKIYRPRYIYCRKSHKMADFYHSVLEWGQHMLLSTGNMKYAIHPDIALLMSTSGTTGSSKLVKLTYENIYHDSECTDMLLGIRSGQKGITPLALNYTAGANFCFWHWHCGATLMTTEESIVSNRFHGFYEREKINNFSGVPYIYQILEKVRFWTPPKIEWLNFAVCGGAKLNPREQINLAELFKNKFWYMYGQTECTCTISSMNFGGDKIRQGSVGKAFEDMEIMLDSSTEELMVKSKSVCMGYADNAEQLAEGDVNHGILHTGDMAYIDQNGYIYLRGRLTRFIKILGKRVSLDEVESYLTDKFPNVEFACIGTDDNITVFHTETGEEPDKTILALLDRNMKLPSRFVSCVAVKEIPRNHSGKVSYVELESLK